MVSILLIYSLPLSRNLFPDLTYNARWVWRFRPVIPHIEVETCDWCSDAHMRLDPPLSPKALPTQPLIWGCISTTSACVWDLEKTSEAQY